MPKRDAIEQLPDTCDHLGCSKRFVFRYCGFNWCAEHLFGAGRKLHKELAKVGAE